MKDILKYALNNIWDRKLRSFLTILSILIGITAIYALVSFGQGLNVMIEQLAQEQGTDKILIMPGGFVPPGTSNIVFSDDDLNFIRKINGVDEATGWIAASGKIKYKDFPVKYPYVFGLSTDTDEQEMIEELFTVEVVEGRNLKDGDVLKVLTGYLYSVPDKMFPRRIYVGDKVEINDVEVEIIGIYDEIGNPSDDAQVYLTFEGMKEIFDIEDFEYIAVRASKDQDPAALADKIKDRFRKRRGQSEGEEDFQVQTFEQAIETFTSIVLVLNGVLVLIAFVSIVVAAVNIMNTMYTSILERTREIGLMKSIGATNRYILLIFVSEAGILGLVGGLVGVFFGFVIASIGGLVATANGVSMLQPAFPWWLTIGSLLFAFFVGAGSGYLPARQASKLKPVEALRYE